MFRSGSNCRIRDQPWNLHYINIRIWDTLYLGNIVLLKKGRELRRKIQKMIFFKDCFHIMKIQSSGL